MLDLLLLLRLPNVEYFSKNLNLLCTATGRFQKIIVYTIINTHINNRTITLKNNKKDQILMVGYTHLNFTFVCTERKITKYLRMYHVMH